MRKQIATFKSAKNELNGAAIFHFLLQLIREVQQSGHLLCSRARCLSANLSSRGRFAPGNVIFAFLMPSMALCASSEVR